jgi:hypothetical protein
MSTTHDAKIISIFEILGAYFTDVIFNHIYGSAKTKSGINATSITEEFTNHINAYIFGIKNDNKCYSSVIQQVHRYFMAHTRFTIMSFAEFVDKVISVITPETYFSQLTISEKDELLGNLICDLVAGLAVFVTKPDMLRRIIDNHKESPIVTIRMIQDAAVSNLITKRDSIKNKFLEITAESQGTVSIETLDKMKSLISNLVREKAEITAKNQKLENLVEMLKQKIEEGKTREGKLTKMITLMRDANAANTANTANKRETLAEFTRPSPRLSDHKRETLAEYTRPTINHIPKNHNIAEKNEVVPEINLNNFFKHQAIQLNHSSQDCSPQELADQDLANQDSANQDSANQDSANQDSANQDSSNQDSSNYLPQQKQSINLLESFFIDEE